MTVLTAGLDFGYTVTLFSLLSVKTVILSSLLVGGYCDLVLTTGLDFGYLYCDFVLTVGLDFGYTVILS